MKHLISILLSSIIISMCFADIPYRFARYPHINKPTGIAFSNALNRNAALLSQILFDEYGDRGVLKILYAMRDNRQGIKAFYASFTHDSTFIVTKDCIDFSGGVAFDSIVKECLNDNDYKNVLRNAIVRHENDTIYALDDSLAPTKDIGILRKNGRYCTSGWLLFPTNLRAEIIDTVAWEQEALKSIKEQMSFINSIPIKLHGAPEEIPDSLMDTYKLYFNHHL